MRDPIQIICSLTGCTEEQANEAYDKTQDTVEAIDLLLEAPKSTTANLKKRPRETTPEEQIIAPIRKLMKEIDEKRSTSSYQHGYEGSVEMLDPPEETAPQSSCVREYQPLSLQLEVQKQETAYPSRSGCFCDSQSSGRTSPYSDQECSRWIPLQGMESLHTDEQITVEVPSYVPFQNPPIGAGSGDQSHIRPPVNFQNYPGEQVQGFQPRP
jgi:hypothetical protein